MMDRSFFVVLIAMLLLVTGCTSGEESKEVSPSSDSGAAVPSGKTLVEGRCTVCHGADRIDRVSHDRAGWERIVDRMIDKGARLDEPERKAVIDYLSGQQ